MGNSRNWMIVVRSNDGVDYPVKGYYSFDTQPVMYDIIEFFGSASSFITEVTPQLAKLDGELVMEFNRPMGGYQPSSGPPVTPRANFVQAVFTGDFPIAQLDIVEFCIIDPMDGAYRPIATGLAEVTPNPLVNNLNVWHTYRIIGAYEFCKESTIDSSEEFLNRDFRGLTQDAINAVKPGWVATESRIELGVGFVMNGVYNFNYNSLEGVLSDIAPRTATILPSVKHDYGSFRRSIYFNPGERNYTALTEGEDAAIDVEYTPLSADGFCNQVRWLISQGTLPSLFYPAFSLNEPFSQNRGTITTPDNLTHLSVADDTFYLRKTKNVPVNNDTVRALADRGRSAAIVPFETDTPNENGPPTAPVTQKLRYGITPGAAVSSFNTLGAQDSSFNFGRAYDDSGVSFIRLKTVATETGVRSWTIRVRFGSGIRARDVVGFSLSMRIPAVQVVPEGQALYTLRYSIIENNSTITQIGTLYRGLTPPDVRPTYFLVGDRGREANRSQGEKLLGDFPRWELRLELRIEDFDVVADESLDYLFDVADFRIYRTDATGLNQLAESEYKLREPTDVVITDRRGIMPPTYGFNITPKSAPNTSIQTEVDRMEYIISGEDDTRTVYYCGEYAAFGGMGMEARKIRDIVRVEAAKVVRND